MTSFTGFSLAEVTAIRDACKAAILAVLANQAYTLNGKSITRANLSEIRATLAEANAEIAELGGTTASEVVINFTGVGGSY